MSGMDRIRERILEDARREADNILQDAQRRADEIRKEAEEKTAAQKAKLDSEYEMKASDIKRRMISTAQLDMRKKVLAAKQDMIDKAFAVCLETIAAMPPEQYRSMIEDLLLQSVKTGSEEVVFSAQDTGRLGSDFLAKVNAKLSASGRTGGLKLSSEKGGFSGGFVLKSGGVEINNTFEALLRLIRQEIEPQIAEMLFEPKG